MSEHSEPNAALDSDETPVGNFTGLFRYAKYDILSGFLVFLIALPLCLGIALSYGYPAIAGVFTAIIGGIVSAFISNSELTIKGPAAGLIAIAAPCVMSFGWNGVPGDLNQEAYRSALAVGVAAGIIQILMGLFRVGSLGEFFPSSVVHGMLAAIGVIIICKMFPLALGVKVGGEPLKLLLGIPKVIQNYEPTIAIVGLVSLAIMFIWPFVKIKPFKSIPAALVVLAVAIPLAKFLDLSSKHTNALKFEEHKEVASAVDEDTPEPEAVAEAASSPVDPPKSDTLISVPAFGDTFKSLTFPKFDALMQPQAWQWVFMFAIIGTLESMLSAKAMDLIDPWQRKTTLDRDNIAVGLCNTLCSFVGATPMISEIVRSRANMDNGARTRFANLYHGLFLLAFVTLLPFLIGMIPVAALMAMLVFTGFRLAHPKEFAHVFKIGPEQLIIYVSTLVGCFAIDLLAGIAIGIVVKLLIHVLKGAPLMSLFKSHVTVGERTDESVVLNVSQSAIFSNWLGLKKKIINTNVEKELVLDFSDTRLVDHTVMANLKQMQKEFERGDQRLVIRGLDNHRTFSQHSEAGRARTPNNSAAR
ncbi:MAG: SulP family inorganic anion transporter [Planctomycetales bacterium]|nr:SulP family inorganic anion transporter [Planctomycetales bacterium]